MKAKKKSTVDPDLEKERQDLLSLMHASIPEELQSKIEESISYLSHPQPTSIKISHEGAANANEK